MRGRVQIEGSRGELEVNFDFDSRVQIEGKREVA